MRTELLSVAKYRDASRPGDDVALVLPGLVCGVFDGATDARGTIVDGVPAGRLAALTVAREMAAAAMDPATADLPAEALIARLSDALRARTAPLGLPIVPSTTLTVVLDCGADWRILSLGDSGVRINGTEVLQVCKLIDDVSTAARVRMFDIFRSRSDDPDAAEAAARRGILLGLDLAVEEGALTRAEAEAILAETPEVTGLRAEAGLVADFLRGGIQTQHRFANQTGNPLCFDTMNGTAPRLGQWLDERRAKSAVHSLEIFSDGYPAPPGAVSVAAWEDAFAAAEVEDYHKTGRFASVKGSTRDEFHDDRTILILADL